MYDARLREFFVEWFSTYADRATERFVGLTDDEYLWEPAPNCWSIRRHGDGYVMDFAWPPPQPPPLTTIAWRLVHLCSMLAEHGLRSVAFAAGKADHRAPSRVPPTAAEALDVFAQSIEHWQSDLVAVTEERLYATMGPEAGPFADDRVAGFVEHIHDEFIHHTAEVALLRDLYRARPLA